eukprot:01807.XXX_6296_6427_1 [CDS] Oithona nana genome sequencing.
MFSNWKLNIASNPRTPGIVSIHLAKLFISLSLLSKISQGFGVQ